jgi:glycosyltransferase involved in cell wall biosynthesis
MRILLVNDYPTGGGAEEHVAGLHSLLANAGHQVERLDGNRAKVNYFGRLGNPLLTTKSAKAMDRFRPDVVHIHKHNLFWGVSPFNAAAARGIPIVCTEHDFGAVCPEGWMVDHTGATCELGFGPHCWSRRCMRSDRLSLDLYRRFNLARLRIQHRTLCETTSLFLAPSRFLVQWLSRTYAPVPARTMPSSIAVGELLRQNPSSPFVVFIASRLEREKGVDLLLRAASLVPRVECRIAGNGSQAQALHSLANELGIADRVTWLGRLDPEGVRRECRIAHLVAQPSVWVEGGGDATLSILEAMAEGCSVASSRFGDSPDIIEDGVNGWLVERGSAKDWIRILETASASPARCLEMGVAGHAKVTSDRSPARLLERVLDAYSFALANNRSKTP